ncbi:MAG: hypothetical protein HY912_24210 [Desulfomonile tiedjei]|uniref:Uncharacterized protein n=1 Tax=Desulfomonile tiedjei TaxID=2358 RepID=A0A9D6Z6K2_9BACT|nr:hypothetical protein [Desulfomonile tiedjei]
MSTLASLTPAHFKKISKLCQKKERLLQKVSAIDDALNAFEAGDSLPKKAVKAQASKNRSKRGQLKRLILDALKQAGKSGHTVAELSKKLGVKTNNIYTWFYTTGKKVTGLKKTKDGRYSL